MSLIDQCLIDLKRHEGFRQFPYKDTVGVLTVAYGRNLQSRGIDEYEASVLLRNDIVSVLMELVCLPCWKGLNDVRRGVLVNMAVNLGVAGLLKFKNTLALIESGRYIQAGDAMMNSQWATQVGSRAIELANRMRTGT